MARVFVGHDWAEAHHDVFIEGAEGLRLERARLPEGVDGVARFHELVGAHVDDPAEVTIATETDRGLFVGALVAAGYRVLAVNPMSTSRYRERHSTSGAKSDPGDAWVLAELARTDGHNHRPIAGDSDLAQAVKVVARAHHGLIWARQPQVNQIRSTEPARHRSGSFRLPGVTGGNGLFCTLRGHRVFWTKCRVRQYRECARPRRVDGFGRSAERMMCRWRILWCKVCRSLHVA